MRRVIDRWHSSGAGLRSAPRMFALFSGTVIERDHLAVAAY